MQNIFGPMTMTITDINT